ncbi:MAG: hypothetical protein IH988_10085, partial [Planctomycetes bacterium]|nr:hypothetical protein [Planctomycetota bacterium]
MSDDIPMLEVRKYRELVASPRDNDPWQKFYKEKLRGSANYSACVWTERGVYLQLWIMA